VIVFRTQKSKFSPKWATWLREC